MSNKDRFPVSIDMKDRRLAYEGRIDMDWYEGPCFVYPCSNVKIRFKGTGLAIALTNHRACYSTYIGTIVDGRQDRICVYDVATADNTFSYHYEKDKGEEYGNGRLFVVCEGLEDTEHEVMIFKRMDCAQVYAISGIFLNDGAELLSATPHYDMKLEFYGDSVTAGEVTEAVDYVGKSDPRHNGEYSNAWCGYAWQTARMLNAEIHDIAQGGISLLDDTGWFAGPDYKGIFNMYDRIQYHPDLGVTKRWDFSLYQPDVVVIAIGQNDAHPVDYMKEDFDGEKAAFWKASYKYFIELIRKRRPNAHIILTTTILMHDPAWDRAIDEVCTDLRRSDEKIYHFMYKRNGTGTPGHIRTPEATEMARELSSFILQL